jgi:hypothetical protein
MSGNGALSPEVLRRIARSEWDREFALTCACDVRTHGVRFESTGFMVCGSCDRAILLRKVST